MIRTLITGANGFTGQYLAQALARAGHRVSGILREAVNATVPGIADTHICDLEDGEGLRGILDIVQPHHVVHLAAVAFVAHGDVTDMIKTNILGTRNLLGALDAMTAKPRSILVASSANIYGNRHGGVLDESLPPAPVNDYGVTKVTVEMLCAIMAHRLPLIITRPFNYTGVGQSPAFLIPKIIDHVRRRASRIELGNLDVARDFSDVRTIVDAYARLLDEPAAIGGTFNICSGRATDLQQVLDSVRRLSGHDFQVSVNPSFVRSDEVKTLCGNPAAIESVIGPLAHVALDETLAWMLNVAEADR